MELRPQHNAKELDPAEEAEQFDVEIGGRVRHARKSAGMTQTQLGDALGVSFQQVQKYERGTNRLSSSSLVIVARVLGVSPSSLLGQEVVGDRLDWGLLHVPGADDLLQAYRDIGSPTLRRIILDLSRRLATDG
jgi:transcriptional regulator with XRE-family HTH domain